ncbi:MAG: TRAP transporter small permease [Alphaproteobacteria bacterium]|nr:TRAP transporter small permease [Alphaproteobacteria bacterium]
MDALEALIRRICLAMLYVATGAGIVLTWFVAVAAVMRYVVGSPFPFTEEVVGLLFVVMVFLTLPYCTIENQHIRVTILSDRFTGLGRTLSALGSLVCVLVFCAVYGFYSFNFASLSFWLNSTSDIGRFTLWPWMAVMPLAALLMGIAAFLAHRRGSGKSDEPEPPI